MPLPDDVAAQELDAEVRSELLSLSKETADLVARHLVMTGRLLDDDPEQALAHARAAGALAGRVGAVREAVGIAAYHAGAWADALSELRAARRITGRADHLAVVADCERALGRPERALAVYDDPAVRRSDQGLRVELAIVVAGARRDLEQPDAAVLLLQGPARATSAARPWAARLWYAFADCLLAAGRTDEAHEWFARAAQVDGAGETDAEDRLLALEGVAFGTDDDGDEDEDEDADGPVEHDPQALQELAATVAPLVQVPPATDQSREAASGAAAAPAPAGESGEPQAEPTAPGGEPQAEPQRTPAGGPTASRLVAPDEPSPAPPQGSPVASPFAVASPDLPPVPDAGAGALRPQVAPVAFVAAEPAPEAGAGEPDADDDGTEASDR